MGNRPSVTAAQSAQSVDQIPPAQHGSITLPETVHSVMLFAYVNEHHKHLYIPFSIIAWLFSLLLQIVLLSAVWTWSYQEKLARMDNLAPADNGAGITTYFDPGGCFLRQLLTKVPNTYVPEPVDGQLHLIRKVAVTILVTFSMGSVGNETVSLSSFMILADKFLRRRKTAPHLWIFRVHAAIIFVYQIFTACWVSTASVLILLLSASIGDILMNCTALIFILEVDNYVYSSIVPLSWQSLFSEVGYQLADQYGRPPIVPLQDGFKENHIKTGKELVIAMLRIGAFLAVVAFGDYLICSATSVQFWALFAVSVLAFLVVVGAVFFANTPKLRVGVDPTGSAIFSSNNLLDRDLLTDLAQHMHINVAHASTPKNRDDKPMQDDDPPPQVAGTDEVAGITN